MKQTSQREIQAVLELNGPERVAHFVKRVVDTEHAWGLWQNGWALMQNDDGTGVLPLWPAREYAELHRTGDWANYESRAISLSDLLEDLLPELADRGVLPAVLPTTGGKGVTPTVGELESLLRQEVKRYE